jgi:hypothetical protein
MPPTTPEEMLAVAVAPLENFTGQAVLLPVMLEPARTVPATADASTAPDWAVMLEGTVHWHSLLVSAVDGVHGISTVGHSVSLDPALAWHSHRPCDAYTEASHVFE